jgi:hypothetical protein
MLPLPPDLNSLIDFNADLRVSSREGKHREFKRNFNAQHVAKYAKTLAAFSNTGGGVLIFGVTDAPRNIVGIDAATFPEEAIWADRLRAYFSPEIAFEIRAYAVQNRQVVAIAAPKGVRLPVICSRDASVRVERDGRLQDEPVLRQGSIYYRQSASTRPIQYVELQAILEERDAQRMQAFLQSIEIMNRIGAEKVGIVDVTKATQPGNGSSLYVSKEVAKTLTFIDRGRFVETDDEGSPAYVVAGTVQLNEIVERIVEDADKTLPQEAADFLADTTREVWGDLVQFGGSHLAKLATALGMRNGSTGDGRHCLYDAKVKRWYYTRDGLAALETAIRQDPLGTLRRCGPKAAIEAFEAQHAIG